VRPIEWPEVVALGQELPESEESTSYGRPALKVRGKTYVALRSDPDALVVSCDREEKEPLLESRPDVVFTTPHYDGYPVLLVRLDAPRDEIRELVVDSWLLKAPARVAAQFVGKS
jgi:hypothetical protein